MSDERVITSIKALASDPTRVSVRVGRESVAKLTRERVDELGLIVGQAWTPALAARVSAASSDESAKLEAVRIVNRRDVSSGELVDRLAKKGFDREACRRVAAELAGKRMIDDAAYGRSVIERELARRAAGPRLLRQKLYQKKLPAQVIDTLLSELAADDEQDQIAAARELAAKKLAGASMKKLDARVRYRRISSLLTRRGFDRDTINAAMTSLREQLRSDEDSEF